MVYYDFDRQGLSLGRGGVGTHDASTALFLGRSPFAESARMNMRRADALAGLSQQDVQALQNARAMMQESTDPAIAGGRQPSNATRSIMPALSNILSGSGKRGVGRAASPSMFSSFGEMTPYGNDMIAPPKMSADEIRRKKEDEALAAELREFEKKKREHELKMMNERLRQIIAQNSAQREQAALGRDRLQEDKQQNVRNTWLGILNALNFG